MRSRFSQPYRGQPRPKYPRPKKKIRNLKVEKKARILVLGVSIVIMGLIFRMLLLFYYASPDNSTLAVMIGVSILFLFIIIAIADGLKSINKFRRGYDIDISGESNEEEREQTESQND